MAEKPRFYTQETTGIRYKVGDLFGYPDSLIRARTSAAYQYGLQLLPQRQYNTIVDFGSGRGHGVKAIQDTLSPKQIISIDKHLPYLESQRIALMEGTQNEDPFNFIQATTIPLDTSTTDIIFFMHVIEHLEDPLSELHDMHRILKPEGTLVIATPNRKNLVGKNPADIQVFTDEELTVILDDIGFSIHVYHLIPNRDARRVHERKKWLAKHAPFTGSLRNHVQPEVWDRFVLRGGIRQTPLQVDDFTLSQEYKPDAIDILVLATKSF